MARDYVAEIDSFKRRIANIEKKNAAVEAEIRVIKKTLKNNYGFNSIEEAKKYVTKLEKEISIQTDELENSIYELREILDGLEG